MITGRVDGHHPSLSAVTRGCRCEDCLTAREPRGWADPIQELEQRRSVLCADGAQANEPEVSK